MFGFGRKKKKRVITKTPTQYAAEFIKAFEDDRNNTMINIADEWEEDYPKDANVHCAHGILISKFVIEGTVSKKDGMSALKAVDKRVRKNDPCDPEIGVALLLAFKTLYAEAQCK
jgi:hypothetical protein